MTDWRLGFSANPEKCELQKLGTVENAAADHQDIVAELYSAAMMEIEHRGLDPALVEWLKSEGKIDFPENFRVTDAHPAPAGWYGSYWNKYNNALGMKS